MPHRANTNYDGLHAPQWPSTCVSRNTYSDPAPPLWDASSSVRCEVSPPTGQGEHTTLFLDHTPLKLVEVLDVPDATHALERLDRVIVCRPPRRPARRGRRTARPSLRQKGRARRRGWAAGPPHTSHAPHCTLERDQGPGRAWYAPGGAPRSTRAWARHRGTGRPPGRPGRRGTCTRPRKRRPWCRCC